MKTFRTLPLFHYNDFTDFYNHMPHDCQLIGVELDKRSVGLKQFVHPQRCIYLLGAEDHGLSNEALNKCHHIVQLAGDYCMNVAVAGSIVLYDRVSKI